MLASLVMLLEARRGGVLPATTGFLTYSAVLDAIASRNAELAGRLHGTGEEKKPFTVSELDGPGRTSGRLEVKPGGRFELRITSMDPDLSAQLQLWVDHAPGRIRLRSFAPDPIEFDIIGATTRSEDHRAAGTGNYEDLFARQLAHGIRRGERLKFRIRSPATFRLKGSPSVNLPFPLPRLVFKHLADQWCAHAPAGLAARLKNGIHALLLAETGIAWQKLPWYELDGSVLVARYALRTHMLAFRHQGETVRQVGFTGTFEYDLRYVDADSVSVLELLADFAFFAGIGYRTTWGMGQGWPVRR